MFLFSFSEHNVESSLLVLRSHLWLLFCIRLFLLFGLTFGLCLCDNVYLFFTCQVWLVEKSYKALIVYNKEKDKFIIIFSIKFQFISYTHTHVTFKIVVFSYFIFWSTYNNNNNNNISKHILVVRFYIFKL